MPRFSSIAARLAGSTGLSDVAFVAPGAFKETYRALTSQGLPVALKILDPVKCNLSRSEREINALKRCDSPFIAKLYDHGTINDPSGVAFNFVVEEFIDGGTLTDQMAPGRLSLNLIKRLSPSLVRSYAGCLVTALDHLKTNKLVHRDIKPDNIMFRLSNQTPVLVDFGLVRDLSESSLTQTWLPQGPGTPFYSAPEQLNNDKQLIGWRTDQFSLGVVLTICLLGRHPFQEGTMTSADVVQAVAQRVRISDEVVSALKDIGFEFVGRMVEPWPHRRFLSPTELLNNLAIQEN